MKKRLIALLLIGCLLLSAAGCGTAESASTAPAPSSPAEPETRVFTDSLGREVTIPTEINSIALSGPMAQIVLFALCPDKLAGTANEWDPGAELYLDEQYFTLPVLGQLYGGKGELNLETLLSSGAQIVVDVGQAKDGAAEDLDALQQQTGLPFVHIAASTGTMDETYRMLGDLLQMEAEAEVLAEYCTRVYQQAKTLSEQVEKVSLLYVTGSTGQNVIARGAYHAEIIDLMSENIAVVDSPSSKGTGNEVSMEQILLWDPEVILFSPESCYDAVAADPAWQEVSAIRNGRYYKVPFGPHNWMGFPPSVQRYPGMLWAGTLLYPEQADYDLYEAVAEHYRLFYHCDLTRDLYDALVADSIGKAAAQ